MIAEKYDDFTRMIEDCREGKIDMVIKDRLPVFQEITLNECMKCVYELKRAFNF